MIPQRNISLITNSLVTDNKRRLPEAVIERDYVLAWFLSGLSNHPLREKLAFKGGTALRRCWFDGYRFSEDMDFTLIEPLGIEDIMTGFGDIHNAVRNDLPEGATILTYSLNEIMVEKIVALSDRARNEPRDLYDLWYLLNHHDSELADIMPELESKLAFRHRTIEDVMQNVVVKEDRLRRLWGHRLSQQVLEAPTRRMTIGKIMVNTGRHLNPPCPCWGRLLNPAEFYS